MNNAKRNGEPVRKKNVSARQSHGFQNVDFEVIPLLPTGRGRHFLVLFQESALEAPPAPAEHPRNVRQVEQLKQELGATRQYLQSIIEEQEATNEELQSANEEILSSNEELQSINEELETAKEELQSTNEELTTVNEELQNRNSELSQINDDLNNLLSNVNIAIVMLGSDLRIRRFTPMAGRMLNLIPTDVGRPITDLRPGIDLPNLETLIREVLDNLAVKEQDVEDAQGRWYSMSIRPYRTFDSRIDGVVITLVDFDTIRSVQERSRANGEYLRSLLEMSGEAFAVLDRECRIRTVNRAFESLVGTPREHLENQLVDHAVEGGGELRRLFDPLLANGADNEQSVTLSVGGRPLRALARVHRSSAASGPEPLILRLRSVES